MKRVWLLLAQLTVLVVGIWLWQWMSSTGRINPFFFGKPSVIYDKLRAWYDDGSLWRHSWATMKLLGTGYILGTLIGIVIGGAIGLSQYVRLTIEPFLLFMNAIPRLILYPFFVVWLGFGDAPKVITVMIVVITIVAVNVSTGIKTVQGDFLENVTALGASWWHLLVHVYLPSLWLWLISTSRVTINYAFQATIMVQFVGASVGLGFLINSGRQRVDINTVFAGLAITVVLALMVSGLLGVAERRVLRTMPSPTGGK